MELLSRLVFLGLSKDFEQPAHNLKNICPDVQYVAGFSEKEWTDFLTIADSNHVEVRALAVLEKAAAEFGEAKVLNRSETALSKERGRIHHAVTVLKEVCEVLEAGGCPVVVIKSLDHWPDLGSDLDLYASGEAARVLEIMRRELDAEPTERSWGDRLANKWNFRVPGLSELIEIHVQYLGQTGEHDALARRVMARRAPRTLEGITFQATSPEELIMISTLQRMYRHFYFRLCDMLDVATLLQKKTLDFAELKKAADTGRIWPGVATFFLLVSRYAQSYGRTVEIPQEVLSAAPVTDTWFEKGFLRVPMLSAARLYSLQFLNAAVHCDLRAVSRLPLILPLGISAWLAYRWTGSDKGVW